MIGGYSWLNNYIGIPYKVGARGPDELDCYGLVKVVYADLYDITLPDWLTDDIDLKERDGLFQQFLKANNWTENYPDQPPDDGDIVICSGRFLDNHIGVYFGGGVLHCREGSGCVYEPLTRFAAQFHKLEFGRWNP